MSETVDVLLLHAHVFTMEGEGVGYLADGAVAIRKDRIVDVGPTATLQKRYLAAETIDASHHALLPGLINAHMHTPLTILRGVAQDIPHWMQRGLAPYERHLHRDAALAGVWLNVLEALRAGTTTMGDYAAPIEGWAEIFAAVGVRAVLTPAINALPAGGMAGWRLGELYPLDEAIGEQRIRAAMEFANQWHGAENGRITVMYGPQAADMLTRDQFCCTSSDWPPPMD